MNPSLSSQHPQYYGQITPKPRLRRIACATLSVLSLCASVFLLYSMILLHFAAGTWAFLQIPSVDPRPLGSWEIAATVFFQLLGGVSLAVCALSRDTVARSLKWSPLFVVAFAVFTWIVALVVAPLHIAR